MREHRFLVPATAGQVRPERAKRPPITNHSCMRLLLPMLLLRTDELLLLPFLLLPL